MLEEVNRLQILIAAILVGNPLSVLLAIIKIEHRRYRIYSQAVHMELLDPKQRIRYQKVSDFILPIIEYLGTPVRMLPLLRVGIFISRGTVKVG